MSISVRHYPDFDPAGLEPLLAAISDGRETVDIREQKPDLQQTLDWALPAVVVLSFVGLEAAKKFLGGTFKELGVEDLGSAFGRAMREAFRSAGSATKEWLTLSQAQERIRKARADDALEPTLDVKKKKGARISPRLRLQFAYTNGLSLQFIFLDSMPEKSVAKASFEMKRLMALIVEHGMIHKNQIDVKRQNMERYYPPGDVGERMAGLERHEFVKWFGGSYLFDTDHEVWVKVF